MCSLLRTRRAQRNTYPFLRRSPVFLVSFTKRFPAGRRWPSPFNLNIAFGRGRQISVFKSSQGLQSKLQDCQGYTEKRRLKTNKQRNKQTENKPKKKKRQQKTKTTTANHQKSTSYGLETAYFVFCELILHETAGISL